MLRLYYLSLFLFSLLCLLINKPTVLYSQDVLKKPVIDSSVKKKSDLDFALPTMIDNFEEGVTQGTYYEKITTIGGYQGTWALRPAACVIEKCDVLREGAEGKKSLKIGWEFNGRGWCGWYTLLNAYDAGSYNAITFWVKGRDGGEKFDIGLADQNMQELEIDAKYIGAINSFLKDGVTTEWQKVKVPLRRIEAEVDLSALGSLVFWFRYASPTNNSVIYIDDIMFEHDPEIESLEELNAPKAELDSKHPRAFWVWKWDPVSKPKMRKAMFDLCARGGIRKCFVYFGEFDNENTEYIQNLESFLKESHEKGIKIEILTGNPIWALKENHQEAINWLKPYLEYNKIRPAELRFDGCSFDVEPYLASEWNTRRDDVKKEYLNLLSQLRTLINSYKDMKFELGAAIPFFYISEGVFEENVLKYLDYAALMAYYDTPKKIIDVSRPHITLAGKLGKKIYIGAETQDLVSMAQGKPANTFYEEGWEYMEKVLGVVNKEFNNDSGYCGIAMHCCYSYKALQKGRNTPSKVRIPPDKLPKFIAKQSNKNISVDGKLDDWDLSNPNAMNTKDQVVFGRGAWYGKDDYSLSSYCMWDASNIYFAFDVTDDKVVQTKTKADMWEGDHIELWLDLNLMGDYNEAVNSEDDFQFGLSPGNFDDIEPEVFLFVPELDERIFLDSTEISASKKANGYIIEVRINAGIFKDINIRKSLQAISSDKSQMISNRDIITLGPDNINDDKNKTFSFVTGLMIGYSIDGSDCDDLTAPQKLIMSTSKERIWGDPTTFNIIKLKK